MCQIKFPAPLFRIISGIRAEQYIISIYTMARGLSEVIKKRGELSVKQPPSSPVLSTEPARLLQPLVERIQQNPIGVMAQFPYHRPGQSVVFNIFGFKPHRLLVLITDKSGTVKQPWDH